MSLNSQIADLILEKGRAQAQGAIASGQAWSGALSQIGQNVGQTIASLPKIQEQAARTADEQRARQARDEFAAALKETPTVEQEGVKLFNVNGIGDRMNAKGYGPEFLPAAQHLDGINAAKLQFRQAQQNVVKQGAAAVAASGNDPTLANHFLDTLDDVYPPEKVQQFRDFIAADPANVAKLTSFLAGPQKPVVLKEGEKGFDPLTNAPIPGLSNAPKPIVLGEGATAVNPESGVVVASGPPKPMTKDKALTDLANQKSTDEQKATAKAWLDLDAQAKADPNKTVTIKTMESGKPVEKIMLATEALKQGVFQSQPPAAIQVNNAIGNQTLPSWALDSSRPTKEDGNKFDPKVGMTPNGLYQSAQTYLQTGQFPPTARGSNPRADAIRSAVTSKVGALAADAGVDVPTFRALYKANSASLAQQQKSADAAQAFLNTADKNSELLEKSLAKIPDTGSPLLNAPLRSLDQKALGSVDMAQFKTYLQSVQNEYAKILTQPTLAGQLTDSARKEAEQLVSGDSTVAQIIGSLQALRAEGGNRIASIGEQIGRIQSRMQGGGTQPETTKKSDTSNNAAAPMTRTIRNTATGETKIQTSTDGGVTWK